MFLEQDKSKVLELIFVLLHLYISGHLKDVRDVWTLCSTAVVTQHFLDLEDPVTVVASLLPCIPPRSYDHSHQSNPTAFSSTKLLPTFIFETFWTRTKLFVREFTPQSMLKQLELVWVFQLLVHLFLGLYPMNRSSIWVFLSHFSKVGFLVC